MQIEEVRALFAGRLRARRSELEAAALLRLSSIESEATVPGPHHLQPAVAAAVDYGIEVLECGAGQPPALPVILLAEVRLAARDGFRLQALIRRYLAGYALLGDFLLEEAERSGLAESAILRQLFESQARAIDRVVATVGEEYARAVKARPRSPRERRSELVDRLLAGELLASTELAYEFDANHLGLIAIGGVARPAVDRLADRLNLRRLTVDRDETTVWAWFGTRKAFDPVALRRHIDGVWPRDVLLVLGEPAASLEGWRLTHRQALASLPIARAGVSPGPTHYSEVAVLACALHSELLATSLRALYLAPVAARHDGRLLFQTLRAYLAADRNASSAAALIGIDRRTVSSRMNTVEECLGRSISDCLLDLQLALELDRIEAAQSDDEASS